MDFEQIRTLNDYIENKEAVDARLQRKSTTAEYEAESDLIGRLVAIKNCHFIFERLEMRTWRSIGDGAWSYCTQAFWRQWRRDRVQITSRVLEVSKHTNGRYILRTFTPDLVALLLSKGRTY